MKFRVLLFLGAMILGLAHVNAQTCPVCIVDDTVHPNLGPEDVGLVPSSITVQAGVDTQITVQYLMPTELTVDAGPPIGIVTATVTGIQVLNIIDLPPSTTLSWTCDQIANGCNYNPQNYRFGCVNLCVNTLASAGVYTANVLVNGCGTAAGITQCQNQLIPMTITVLPPAGNPFFEVQALTGCDSVANTFTETLPATLPINPTAYSWDFAGQATAMGASAAYTFVGAGSYIVAMTETIEEYYITDATLTITDNSCFCGDVEEPDWPLVGCTASPEPYLVINTGGNNVTLDNNNSNASQSWSGLDIPLLSNAVSFQAWEEDLTSQDDNLGSTIAVFNSDPGVGTQLFTTSCATGTFTLAKRLLSTETYYDTIVVLPNSNVPTITNLMALDTFCTGDSVVLECSASGTYRWFKDGIEVQGENNQTITAMESGSYSVTVTDVGTVCEASSAMNYDVVEETVTAPVITLDNTTGNIVIDNPNGYAVQWFSNGVPIPGATTNELDDLTSGGPFTVTVTSDIGCEATSLEFTICLAGTSAASGSVVDLTGGVTFTASGFTMKPGNEIAWAVSTSTDGAITDMVGLQAAIDAGWVLPGDDPTSLTLDCGDLDLENGDYVMTPISAASLVIDSLIFNPAIDSGCIPDAEICLEIGGTDWLIIASTLTFTFPDGQSVGVIDALVPPEFLDLIPDTITPDLLNLLPQFLPNGLCFQLFDLYQGDPNGDWTISANNVGPGTVTVDIPAFTSTVLADSCSEITQDQIINVGASSGTISGNGTGSLTFTLPPLPANFPTINSDCNVFGSASSFTFTCATGIEDYVAVNSLNLYPNPNNGLFTVSMELLEREDVTMQIIDVTGRLVMDRTYNAVIGNFTETIDLKNNLSSGFYVLNLVINQQQIQKHFIVE